MCRRPDMARKKPGSVEENKKAKLIAKQAAAMADWAAKALVAAEKLEITKKPVDHFPLAPAQRDFLLSVPGLSKTITNKLAKETSSFSVAEVASMTMALAEDLREGEAQKQMAVLLVAKHLTERLQEHIGAAKPKVTKAKKPKVKADASTLFQFKITLKETTPPIWRRIQVPDC